MDWIVQFCLYSAFLHLPECREWSVSARRTVGHAAALAVIAALRWRVNVSTHVKRFLASTHECRARDCMDRLQEPFDKSSVWPYGEVSQAFPAFTAPAQQTVPHSWIRLVLWCKTKFLGRFIIILFLRKYISSYWQ